MTAAPAAPVAAAVNNLRGALCLMAAALFFTGDVVAVRLLEGDASDGQIVFARASVQLVVIGAWIAATQPGLLRTQRPGLHALRGLTSLICWWLYYRSFQSLDLALATILTFSTSLFVVLFAGPVLGEIVGRLRWAMTLLGFAGIAVATVPDLAGTQAAPLGVAAGLGAALAAAVLIFQNRVLSRSEPTVTIMFYIGLVTTLGTLPVLLASWRPLEAEAVLLLTLSGALGTAGMLFTIEAYRLGEVSALAPFPYLRLVFSAFAGLVLFAEVPGLHSAVGAALIVISAVVMARAEARSGG
ncbi:MAG: DMT family transporter [Pseudomonadota bacterium]